MEKNLSETTFISEVTAKVSALDSLSAVHGLLRIVAELDSHRREEMFGLIESIELEPYSAPKNKSIEIVPDHPTSRECALDVEKFSEETDTWVELHSGYSPYRDAVQYRRHDVFFHGQTVEKDKYSGAIYVYSKDRKTRVEANTNTMFYEVSTKRSST